MTDKTSKAHTPKGTREHNNPDPGASHSGLDVNGQMRIGDTITIAIRGSDILLMQANSGREVTVSPATISGLLEEQYFTDHVD